jgi:uncharacterized membrane protein YfcA
LEVAILCAIAFLAGLVDAVVGGGGLLLLPALFSFLPNTPPGTLFGTNKFSSIAGTTTAIWRYSLKVAIPWKVALSSALAAFIFSFIGARVVSALPVQIIRPVVLVLLIAVALYTFFQKNLGILHAPKLKPKHEILIALISGALLGFYDGFFGPGTGSFLIFVFIRIFGFDFLTSSASAKVVNFSTNLGALIYFAFTNQIIFALAIPMAVCSVCGAFAGSHLAIKKGSAFVRRLFLVVVCLIIIKFAYDTFKFFA